jgi:hypothetical protein
VFEHVRKVSNISVSDKSGFELYLKLLDLRERFPWIFFPFDNLKIAVGKITKILLKKVILSILSREKFKKLKEKITK